MTVTSYFVAGGALVAGAYFAGKAIETFREARAVGQRREAAARLVREELAQLEADRAAGAEHQARARRLLGGP